MFVDTTIFVDFLKGKIEAVDFFKQDIAISTSQFAVMEIIFGLANKRELLKFEKFLKKTNISVVPITEEISKKAYALFASHVLANRIDIPDAFIAATAIVFNQNLATLNTKHFKPIKKLSVVKPY